MDKIIARFICWSILPRILSVVKQIQGLMENKIWSD